MIPEVIFENKSFIVINKPSGLVVHGTSERDTQSSVVSWLLEKYPEVANVGDEPKLRPGIVHRLDKETSGIMLIARTQEAFEYFKKQFQDRLVQKTYIALVHGNIKDDSGTIDAPLGKLGTKQTTRIVGKKELTVRDAVTDYAVLKRYDDYTLVEARPKTGRTHQIRVHFNHIGRPIVCDPLYGGAKKKCPADLGRLFLHAQKLEFTDPEGKRLAFEADMSPVLQDFLKTLDK